MSESTGWLQSHANDLWLLGQYAVLKKTETRPLTLQQSFLLFMEFIQNELSTDKKSVIKQLNQQSQVVSNFK